MSNEPKIHSDRIYIAIIALVSSMVVFGVAYATNLVP